MAFVTDFNQVGRSTAPDPNLDQVSVTQKLDFSAAADDLLDFTLINQTQVFGIPRTLYIDNGTNPNPVTIYISITNQSLTVAPFSIGYYSISAADKSTIRLTTDGGATEFVTVSAFNHVIPPSVWYAYGTSNPVAADAVQGSVPEGTLVAAAASPNPVYSGGIDRATGLAHGLSVDATGILDVVVTNAIVAAISNLPAQQGAYVDGSIAALSGVSEALFAANAARRVLVLNNPNAANPIAVNLSGGVAALNTAGSITIAAGQTIIIDQYPPTGAITVIGTVGDDITAMEG